MLESEVKYRFTSASYSTVIWTLCPLKLVEYFIGYIKRASAATLLIAIRHL